ncbi:AbiV family abortive infection protein [Bradyrhizobium liaoningense]|uniref:AbiV family abortive infection protein n=1 Tax=Bradyrhizobium liaoningense TaxID=43992 RepID=UPI001BAA5B9D|nr:AbiV family abortive infection protein [Bradyrhizobium liaoningense]MBR0947854.1 AbiV family abortive infection protein [Bradyrhizobium liaoningense]
MGDQLVGGPRRQSGKGFVRLQTSRLQEQDQCIHGRGLAGGTGGQERGDWEAAGEEFKKFQMQFHKASNDAKNASLYVDWQGEEFVSPSERISPEMLAQIVAQNTAFLPNSPTSPRMVMFSFGACLSGCQ